jgi:transcriptional regulator with XRE-family HTH domain
MKTKERELARELRRRRRLPIKQIARLVGVAPSSVSVWVRDVPLTARQADALRRLNPAYNRQLRGATRNAERGRERRRAYQEEGQAIAKRGDALHVAGVMLYWAEGDKSSKNCARISNSDAEVLRLLSASFVSISTSPTRSCESRVISSRTTSSGSARSSSTGSTWSISRARAYANRS